MKSEAQILREVQQEVSRCGARCFRNNQGLFFTADGRPITVGMGVGTSDLIGWAPYTVTEGDIGRQVAIFLAVECKSARGKITRAQDAFLARVLSDGGIGVVARCPEDINAVLNQFRR